MIMQLSIGSASHPLLHKGILTGFILFSFIFHLSRFVEHIFKFFPVFNHFCRINFDEFVVFFFFASLFAVFYVSVFSIGCYSRSTQLFWLYFVRHNYLGGKGNGCFLQSINQKDSSFDKMLRVRCWLYKLNMYARILFITSALTYFDDFFFFNIHKSSVTNLS